MPARGTKLALANWTCNDRPWWWAVYPDLFCHLSKGARLDVTLPPMCGIATDRHGERPRAQNERNTGSDDGPVYFHGTAGQECFQSARKIRHAVRDSRPASWCCLFLSHWRMFRLWQIRWLSENFTFDKVKLWSPIVSVWGSKLSQHTFIFEIAAVWSLVAETGQVGALEIDGFLLPLTTAGVIWYENRICVRATNSALGLRNTPLNVTCCMSHTHIFPSFTTSTEIQHYGSAISQPAGGTAFKPQARPPPEWGPGPDVEWNQA